MYEYKQLKFSLKTTSESNEFQASDPGQGPRKYTSGNSETVLIDSLQSMANQLENTKIDKMGTGELLPIFSKMPHIIINHAHGKITSVQQDHRFCSGHLKQFITKLAENYPVQNDAPKTVQEWVASVDFNALIHGFDGRTVNFAVNKRDLKQVRLVTSRILAKNAVLVGNAAGVKHDAIQTFSKKNDDGKKSSELGIANIIFPHNNLFTSENIIIEWEFDGEQLCCGPAVAQYAYLVALWELKSLLSRRIRYRSACTLILRDEHKDEVEALVSDDELKKAEIAALIELKKLGLLPDVRTTKI